MSVSIISCPSCKQLILSDTVQCPTCQHVMDEDRAKDMVTELPAVVRAAEDEVPCPDCGEQVRAGLVRCWRCGGFLREEIAESYQKMLDGPQSVTYSDPNSKALAEAAPPPEKPTAPSPVSEQPIAAEDDDFQLAPGLNLMSEEQHALQQVMAAKAAKDAAKAAQAKTASSETSGDSETYSLGAKSDPSAEATPATETAEEKPAEAVADSSTDATGTGEEKAEEGAPASDSAEKQKDDKQDEAPADPLNVGADALLEIAQQEEKETAKRRKTRKKEKAGKEKVAMPGYLFVYCPNGHQIQVDEKFRGMTGRCPRCKSFYHVPALDWRKEQEEAERAKAEEQKESRFTDWMVDVRLHQLDPTKLKLKPGSLEKDFVPVDLGFAPDEWLLVGHGKQGAGFAKIEKNAKKVEPLRAEVQEHLRLEKEVLDLPAATHRRFEKDELAKFQIVQPAPYAHESMFAGVPVFGDGRVAIRLPVTEQDQAAPNILFMSFALTEFRKLSSTLADYGVENFGVVEGIPMEDEETIGKCHYSDREIKSINATIYHNVDPQIELELVGRKCQACGLVVSEESRKKEKLGGAAGKGIAKADCPKCKQKFGSISLFGIKSEEGATEDDSMMETGGVK